MADSKLSALLRSMGRPELNTNVRTLCARHWDGRDMGCSRCPIRVACHSGPTTRMSYESMDEHTLRRNAAADAAVGTPQADLFPPSGGGA